MFIQNGVSDIILRTDKSAGKQNEKADKSEIKQNEKLMSQK